METNEIFAIVFGGLILAGAIATIIWLFIEEYHEVKEKKLKEDEEKAKLICRVDAIEHYLNVLWWERENDKKDE